MLVGDIARIRLDSGIEERLSSLSTLMDSYRHLDGTVFSSVLRNASFIGSIDSTVAIEGNHLGSHTVADMLGER